MKGFLKNLKKKNKNIINKKLNIFYEKIDYGFICKENNKFIKLDIDVNENLIDAEILKYISFQLKNCEYCGKDHFFDNEDLVSRRVQHAN